MGGGWKFVGEFRRGRKEPLALACIVAISDQGKASAIANDKLVGADEITATRLSPAEIQALKLKEGEFQL